MNSSTPVPADQLLLELPGLSPQLRPVQSQPRRRPLRPVPAVTEIAAAARRPAEATAERVWLVWEDDEVLGVYADRDTATADCAALRRAARRAPLPIHYECLPVPVFNTRRHTHPDR